MRREALQRPIEDWISLTSMKGGDSRKGGPLPGKNLVAAQDWIEQRGLVVPGSDLGSKAVPEPSLVILVGIGILGVLCRRR